MVSTDHTNSGVWYWVIAGGFTLMIVVTKLTAPRIEDTPAKCREKIVRSAEAPACAELGWTRPRCPSPRRRLAFLRPDSPSLPLPGGVAAAARARLYDEVQALPDADL